MYQITLFHRNGDVDTATAAVTVSDVRQLRDAARALANKHGLPTDRITTSKLLSPDRARSILGRFSRFTIGLTEPENPTVPDNLIGECPAPGAGKRGGARFASDDLPDT